MFRHAPLIMLPSKILRSTINAAEIAHFSRLSSQWWDEAGEFAFLHQMNPVRMQFIRQKLCDENETPLKDLDVLDVGCGGGLLSESLARLGAYTLGIDASESNIAIARHHASTDYKLRDTITYAHTSAEDLLEKKKQYDVVCSMEVLEHVDNPAMFLQTCADLVKPSGHLFLSTISRTPLAYFLTILMAEDIFRKVARGTHTYHKFVKPGELVEFFQDRSWITTPRPTRTQAEIRGLIYNPLQTKWMLGSRDTFGTTACNYMFWVRKPPLPSQ